MNYLNQLKLSHKYQNNSCKIIKLRNRLEIYSKDYSMLNDIHWDIKFNYKFISNLSGKSRSGEYFILKVY